jgi:hypothetical protein
VSLPRQQAAMIPIVSGDIEGQKLSLYNADTDPRFPLNAVRLTNSTGLHLKGGPLTLFDGGLYAGDARMEEIPPGDSRLVTYAVDLGVECERRDPGETRGQVRLSIRRGTLHQKRQLRKRTVYTLKSKAQKARLVYVEHPYRSDWTLVEPESPAERSAQFYRFAVRLAPGGHETLTVTQEKPLDEMVSLTQGALNLLLAYTSGGEGVSPAIIAALSAVVERRRHIQELDGQAALLEQERNSIHNEQDRIRKNMSSLDRDSALYRRYVGELDQQETRLAELRAQVDSLRAQSKAADDALNAYADCLEME